MFSSKSILSYLDSEHSTSLSDLNKTFNFSPLNGLGNISVWNVCCGLNHVLLLTTQKYLYSFGEGDNGRLGHGDTSSNPIPKLIEKLIDFEVNQITCSDHSCCVLVIPRKSPYVVKYFDFEEGFENCCVVEDRHTLMYSWGRGNCGCLG